MPVSEPQHPSPGTIIAGKYELEGLLGEGGMGAVYQATNLAIGRRVAIKILHASVADRDDVRKRFEMEARAAAVISHPGIVDVLDMGQTEEGEAFIVMEHLEGVTLRSLVKELKTLTPEQAVGVMAPVLDALSAAHRAGVIHRDVKPANIFVCARPQVIKLLDFGVSRFGRSKGLTLTGAAVGTPRYMAPEQILGEEDIGPEADLYSVGAVLYAMLSGKLPHGSGSDMALLARAIHDTPAPLASLTTGLPPALCALIDSLLLKDRAKRPKNAAKVREALLESVPHVDTDALFASAQRSARAVALAPTPSASGANLRKVATPKPNTKSGAPTRASGAPIAVEPAPRSKVGLIVGLAVGAIVLGGVAAVIVRQQLTPAPLAPDPEPVVAVVEPPPPPTSVVVTLKADPPQAHIIAGGVELTCNPCTLSGAPGSRQAVRVTAPGMAEAKLEVVFDQPRTENVTLVAMPVAAVPDPVSVDAGAPTAVKKKKPKGLSVDEKNPYQ